MKRIGSKTVYEGRYSSVRIDEFRYADGSTEEREVVSHPPAVGMVAHDSEHVWLVRQPREAVGEEALLEIPAGKLDVDGESPLECARRELVEEIGKSARQWRELKHFYLTPGWADEEMTIFEATELDDAETDPDPGERIEIVAWPLADLEGAIEQSFDAKTLIGLLMLRDLLR
jgi:8-oxo-dGTP pyrophosphatase MutT (NUDIX family)